MKKNSGFTLIEIIACLVLMGIIMLFAGMGLVETVESYIFSRNNHAMAQKVQLTMTRLNLELMYLDEITLAQNDRMDYYNSKVSVRTKYRIRYRDVNRIIFNPGIGAGGSANTLIDGLGDYTGKDFLVYKKTDGSDWIVSDGLSELAYIEVLIIYKRIDGEEFEFTSIIDIRNNGNSNAVTPDL